MTSNKGSHDFQLTEDVNGERLFEKVLRKSQEWASDDRMTVSYTHLDLKDALYEKYNIHIGEHTLKCHSKLYKLVDSIWNEYTKHSNSDARR